MSYDEEQSRKSRVVVETPTSRREVTQTDSVRNPDSDRGGISGATVGVIVVVAIALITIVVLFLMNNQQNDNANRALQQQTPPPPTTVVQQPAPQQQPPVIIQQPAPAPNQPPVIINQPAPATSGAAPNTSNDGAVQSAIDKKISEDPTFSTLGITATVLDGKVTLTGTVKNEALKTQVERMIRGIKGVKQVDNQIVAMG
ncbi:MAG: BON domain-containing protein [Pyrinomonadaceae bacterium]